jgi:Rrf2 family cysteine metabolism transcriptional repressor
MKFFSEKVNYGIAAMFELAKKHASGYLQAQQIAEAQNIPKNYLIQLLITLKKAGFVDSIRGASGGYYLAKQPRQISILDVIEVLEGPISFLGSNQENGALTFFWKQIEESFKTLLNVSLEDLVNRDQGITFEI